MCILHQNVFMWYYIWDYTLSAENVSTLTYLSPSFSLPSTFFPFSSPFARFPCFIVLFYFPLHSLRCRLSFAGGHSCFWRGSLSHWFPASPLTERETLQAPHPTALIYSGCNSIMFLRHTPPSFLHTQTHPSQLCWLMSRAPCGVLARQEQDTWLRY